MDDLSNKLKGSDGKLGSLASELKETHSVLVTERRKWSTEADALRAELEQLRRNATREQQQLANSRREIDRLNGALEVPSRSHSLTAFIAITSALRGPQTRGN